MKIKVTKGNITDGTRDSCSRCPIALALCSAFPNKFIMVGTCTARIGVCTYCLPSKAHNFILKFDAGLPVKPFTFELI